MKSSKSFADKTAALNSSKSFAFRVFLLYVLVVFRTDFVS